ncbi:MAG: ring-cleaving dioxygenase [Opitutales bacterium]
MSILGLHHMTAIAADAQQNLDFYRDVLGLRFIKKTVNFDDPSVYHFYFADGAASPGSVLTFFPWAGIVRGEVGAGQISAIAFEAPAGSLEFWQAHLTKRGVSVTPIQNRFGSDGLAFKDPEGLPLEILGYTNPTDTPINATAEVSEANALRGLATPTLLTREAQPTIDFLADTMGAIRISEEGNRTRLSLGVEGARGSLDVLQDPKAPSGRQGFGTVHHIAVAIADDATQEAVQQKIAAAGHWVTPMRDRQYFHSIYFPEPAGVLCEIATLGPGFTVDEAPDKLGTGLMLPEFLEPRRAEIEAALVPVK